MAKGKGKQKSENQTPPSEEKNPVLIPEESDPERFSAFQYMAVNVAFWIFCMVNYYVAKWFMGEGTGLVFFFSVISVGFTAACIISYLHDRFYEDDLPTSESP
ncbi:MAG: hypothetical protein KC964_03365 [Candidatus Omnitrophica bacterium]|nr:hypothetical protein [Candidatus Omnitrophota bacterium]